MCTLRGRSLLEIKLKIKLKKKILTFCIFIQVLKRPEYFGRFGKIHKVVINNSTSYAGSQVSFTTLRNVKY